MANKVSIRLSTHNINGFKEDYLNSRCDANTNSILCIQEHWLRPTYKKVKGINQLRTIHSLFDGYGVSAMKRTHTDKVRYGRGYGGTGFVFNKHFTPFLRPLIRYENDRMTVMEIKDVNGPILLINVYCPFRQTGDEHRVQYLEMLGLIENVLESNPSARFIVVGDFNYNIFDYRQQMSIAINELLSKYDLICTHDLDPSFSTDNSFTRSCEKNGSYTLLDYIFISRSLRDCVGDCRIHYDGGCPSDHFPVEMKLEVEPELTSVNNCSTNAQGSNAVKWSSLPDDVLHSYELLMEELLDSVIIPTGLLHGDKYCSHESHLVEIEQYFQSILEVIAICDSHLPRKPTHGKKGKGFWSNSLTQLKLDSISSYDNWNRAGRPSSGPLFDRKKACHYQYKAELRRQRGLYATGKSESLSGKLLQKDYVGFWRDWKLVSQVRIPPVNRINESVTESEIADTFNTFFQQIYGDNSTEAHGKLHSEFMKKFPTYFSSHQHDSITPFLLSWQDMITIVGKLKNGKITNSFLRAEHILNGSPKLITHIHILFNAFIQHGFVP